MISNFLVRAGDGNRTRITSLEGWGSAIELRPRVPTSRRVPRGRMSTASVPATRREASTHSQLGLVAPARDQRRAEPEEGRLRSVRGMWRSLVSAPALGAGGRRFESGHPDHRYGYARSW
jgi:hypothetical protein